MENFTAEDARLLVKQFTPISTVQRQIESKLKMIKELSKEGKLFLEEREYLYEETIYNLKSRGFKFIDKKDFFGEYVEISWREEDDK